LVGGVSVSGGLPFGLAGGGAGAGFTSIAGGNGGTCWLTTGAAPGTGAVAAEGGRGGAMTFGKLRRGGGATGRTGG
jgi:hypothetical protein